MSTSPVVTLDVVVVHRVDTDRPWPSPGAKAVGMGQFGKLLQLILDVASGKKLARNEEQGYREIAIWKEGVTL